METAVALVVGTAILSLTAFAVHLMRVRRAARPHEPSDIDVEPDARPAVDPAAPAKIFNAFILGRVPLIENYGVASEIVDYPTAYPQADGAKALSRLASTLTQGLGEHGRVVALSPLVAGVGTTSLAVGLAEAAARQNKRVLLIDVDGEEAGASVVLRASTRQGISDVLSKAVAANRVVLPRGSFRFLPVGTEHFDLAASRKGLAMFLMETRTRFDLILIDTGVFSISAAFATLVELVDGFALVTTPEGLHGTPFVAAIDAVAPAPSFAGLILNRVGEQAKPGYARAS